VEQPRERRLGDGPAVEAGRIGELDRDARDPRRVLGIRGDLRIEPACELEQPREVDALSRFHLRMIDQLCAVLRPSRE